MTGRKVLFNRAGSQSNGLSHLTMMKLAGMFMVMFAISFHQKAVTQTTNFPFSAGERLYYSVVYNWRFVWVKAGKVEFSVDSSSFDGRPAYHFKSFGRTLTGYDWFFKVRNHFESAADTETLQPFWYQRNTREGRYWVNNAFEFDHSNRSVLVQTENANRPFTEKVVPFHDGLLDVQTAVYYARANNFDEMKIDDQIFLDLIIDGGIYNIYGRYHGKELIENYDGKRYRCHKFSVLLVEGAIFSGGEELFVWVTDDGNKIPILVEAKIHVGSVKAYFSEGINLKFPMTSLID